MSPRNFAKEMISPYFLSDPHYIDDRPKKIGRIRRFINLLRTPAKMEFEAMPYQTRPEVPEAEIDLRALRDQRRAEAAAAAAKQAADRQANK
jgi:hypothetical protein